MAPPAAAVREAVVLVLGDVGRSPRMQYHALSLASLPDVHVTLVGTAGEPCCPPVEQSNNITQLRLQPPQKKPSWLPFIFFGPFKVLRQILQLFSVLLTGVPRPSWILMQNPPSIPTLFVVWVVCRLRGSKMIIDWHNFGYSLLALKLGAAHPFVFVSRVYERLLGARADGNLCVTRAMQQWLQAEWGIR
jgi:beta-1,4-mannosyltransferase